MDRLAWFASEHAWLVHLPAAAALLLPFPISAALRGGRGIRPWWTTCRYLAWTGWVGTLLAVLSGFLLARQHGMLAAGSYWASARPGLTRLFQFHEAGGLTALVLGAACLRALYRKRQDHQGIGVLALLFGLLWAASALVTSYDGALMLGRVPAPIRALSPGQDEGVQHRS